MSCHFSADALHYEFTPVDNLFMMEYMHHASAVQLRVYLYGLMLCRYPSMDGIALHEALQLTREEIIDAFAYWQKEGLLYIRNTDPLDVEYSTPSARAAQPTLIPGKYHALVQAAQSLFAPRTLRPAELRRIYDWIEVYSLDEGAVLECVSYCLNRKGDKISMRYMDTVARAWADAGVHTAEEARAHAAAHDALTGGAAAVLKRFGKSRRPTQDELALYEKWTRNLGFTPEAVLAACAATTSAGDPSFKYLDTILRSFHQNGSVTEQAVLTELGAKESDALLARQVFEALGLARAASLAERAQLQAYIHDGLPVDVLLYAAQQCQSKERAYGAFKRLIKDYQERGVASLEAAQAHVPIDNMRGGKKAAAMEYEQTTYKDAELEHIFIPLDQ